MKQFFILTFQAFFLINLISAQSDFSNVYTILNTNCTASTCHSGGSPAEGLDFNGSMNDVYQAIVNVTPENNIAASKGDKLVSPGYPAKSFLLRKLAHNGWDSYYKRSPAEGDRMPLNGSPLDAEDIELIRQWIYFGASNGQFPAFKSVIHDYYNGMGIKKLKPLDPPAPSEGFQIRLGSLILAPLQEIEIDKKHKLELDDDVEVTKIELLFNKESHHFIIYGLGNPSAINEGIRIFDGSEFGNINDRIIAAWQDPNAIELPPTTAYFFDKDLVLDLNYHLINYDPDSVLAADVYLNVYTQQKGIAEHEMFSQIVPVDAISSGGNFGQSLVVPNDGQPHTFTDNIYHPFAHLFTDPIWHIWMLSSHTHARGIDYDVYFRNTDGTKGAQLFEGHYNFDYSFNQGFYDWEHPPIRYFEPPFPVVDISKDGLIQEATFVNPPVAGSDTLYWGFTTNDEMMLIFVQYTKEAINVSGIEENVDLVENFTVSPNPFKEKTTIQYVLRSKSDVKSDVKIEVFNILGERINTLLDKQQNQGKYEMIFKKKEQFGNGVFLVRLSINGNSYTKRIISVD